tara:strand:- start:420 stop:581 length:162 start_codon:yes stop_codon:yes gene_type:complete
MLDTMLVIVYLMLGFASGFTIAYPLCSFIVGCGLINELRDMDLDLGSLDYANA